MLSEREIRKHYIFNTEHELDKDNKMLKEYIEQLEKENHMFKDFYMNCGKEDITKNITATHYEKIKNEGYWQGYIAKQNEAVEICKQCKYRKKARELETKLSKDEVIQKNTVEERKNKLQKEYKEALEENSTKAFILKCQITILEELLNN